MHRDIQLQFLYSNDNLFILSVVLVYTIQRARAIRLNLKYIEDVQAPSSETRRSSTKITSHFIFFELSLILITKLKAQRNGTMISIYDSPSLFFHSFSVTVHIYSLAV